jgi:3'-5' exoribonuclease
LGRLQGHAALGARFLRALADGWPGFPGEKMDLLEHLLLSHHGEPEFGAPVRPQLLEALVLHHLDNLDAKVEAVDAFLNEGTDGEGWSPYHRTLEGYFRRTPALDLPPGQAGEKRRPQAGRDPAPEEPAGSPTDDRAGRLF